MLTDNWVLIPRRSFILVFFFLELMLRQNTIFHFPARYHIKDGVNERRDLHTTSLLLTVFKALFSPHLTSFSVAVNINLCCHLLYSASVSAVASRRVVGFICQWWAGIISRRHRSVTQSDTLLNDYHLLGSRWTGGTSLFHSTFLSDIWSINIWVRLCMRFESEIWLTCWSCCGKV